MEKHLIIYVYIVSREDPTNYYITRHVTPLLIELHWLPVEYRIIFKILLITFKILNGIAPNYLKDLLEPRRTLRSMSKLRLVEPSYKLNIYGLRAFSVCAPRSISFTVTGVQTKLSVGPLFCLAY